MAVTLEVLHVVIALPVAAHYRHLAVAAIIPRARMIVVSAITIDENAIDLEAPMTGTVR